MLTLKHLSAIGVMAGMLVLTACTTEEKAFATGAVVGAVVVASFDHPKYRDRPYYYYNDRYYYGGTWRNGYYYYKGRRYYGGHYYTRYDRRNHIHYRDRY
jgi:hypothetical protein